MRYAPARRVMVVDSVMANVPGARATLMVLQGERISDVLRVGAKAGHVRHRDKVLQVVHADTDRLLKKNFGIDRDGHDSDGTTQNGVRHTVSVSPYRLDAINVNGVLG